jgi:hypothetical protein
MGCGTVLRLSGIWSNRLRFAKRRLGAQLDMAFGQAVEISGIAQLRAPICCALRSHRLRQESLGREDEM